MEAVQAICDFVNTADLENRTDSLTDAACRDVREAIRTLLRANNGVRGDIDGASRLLDEAARQSGLRVGFANGVLAFRSDERDPLADVLAAVAETMAEG